MNICIILRRLFCKDEEQDFAIEVDRVQEIKRLKYILAPILAHADNPDTAPPLRISVSMAREMKEKIDGKN